jgi:putative lipoic acid-binding regulatory protein
MKNNNKAIQFPCSYPLKVMGENTNDFYAVVSAIIEKYIVSGEKVTYHSRTSSGNKYISITATFTAQSKEQLDAIYQELNGHELVLTTL